MKSLLLITRILLFLSFLLPFFFFEMCGPSKKESGAHISKVKQDSINLAVESQRQADSIAEVIEKQRVQDSINTPNRKLKNDTLKASELKNNVVINKTSRSKEKKEDKLVREIWNHMLLPTDHSISGLGWSILIVELNLKLKFELKDLLNLLIPLNYLIALILLLLFIFKKIKLSRIFSVISIILFIIGVFLYHEQGILWGFWVAFILNMIDLVLVNLILYKAEPD